MAKEDNHKKRSVSKENKEKEKEQDKKESTEGGKEESLIPDEILESLDPEERRVIERSIMFSSGRMQNPIAAKITPEHIGKIIENSEKQDEREGKDRNYNRLYVLALVVISIVFVSFLLYIFKSDKDVLIPLITGLLSFLGGLGVGKSIK